MYYNLLAKSEYRNKLCPCGSGIKTKKCHGFKRHLSKEEMLDLKTIIDNAMNNNTMQKIKEIEAQLQEETNDNR